MPKPWTVLSRRTLLSDPWLRLHAEQVRTGQGIELDPWYVVEAANWVTMVAVLPDGRLVLVEQYRHGAERICRELPAGNIDAGEDPAAAALRELAEETGYQAISAPVPLGTLWPEPARSRVTATGFLVRCAAVPQAQQLEESEDIAVVTVTQAEAFGPTHGGIVHATQLAFLHLARPLL
jgi:8-oxo-dGTP pyrophosphatase MutT (NUDIX family)